MQLCFVSTRRGSHFMTELLAAMSDAMTAQGHSTELALDEFPQRPNDCVYVVVPHEFEAWGDPAGFPDANQRARTIAFCTENRGTEWFEATYRLVPQFAAAVSINRSSAAELQRRGVRCEHVQLGYVPSWDTWQHDTTAARDIDVLYLGAADPRRDPLLAGLGKDLAARQCQLLVPPLEPRTAPRPDFLTGSEKYHRLRASRILLNLHRTTSAALEWMRFLEAICNGCVVVSEPCLDGAPLVAGEHYVEADVDGIGRAIDRLLDEPEQVRLMRERAYDFVRRNLPMQPAARALAELAAELPRRPAAAIGSGTGHNSTEKPSPEQHGDSRDAPKEALEQGARDPQGVSPRRPNRGRALVRSIFGARERANFRSRGHMRAGPRVSVLSVVMPGGEAQAAEGLTGLTASFGCGVELLAIGDAASGSCLERFAREHSSLALTFFERKSIEGMACEFNRLIECARGDYVFVLEPTGGACPATLPRLQAALDSDPAAHFAYSMVGVFDGERPVKLRSSLPWEPERLAREDWIDAMSLFRRERILELECFTTDPHLAGWQAFDLFCKCAEAGGHGLHVAQVLAWRCRSPDTMSAEHDDPATLRMMMAELHPDVFGPADGHALAAS
jgi:hypothetical protein